MLPQLFDHFLDGFLDRIGHGDCIWKEPQGEGRRVRVARLPASTIPRAVTTGEMRGYLKAVVDADTDQILGVAILAAEGGEVMSVVQTAMRAGLPSSYLRDKIFAHPTMAERSVREAEVEAESGCAFQHEVPVSWQERISAQFNGRNASGSGAGSVLGQIQE